MLTFEHAYEFTKTIGSHTSFEKEESEKYFDVLMSLPEGSKIVEIGLEYGRSSSIAMQVAKERNLFYFGIDLWPDPAVQYAFEEMAGKIKHPYWARCIYRRDSRLVHIEDIKAILIDGDHSYEGVMADCEHFLPHVTGCAMLHDYQRESLPEVTRAVDDYMENRAEWVQQPTVGTLGIWKRI